jgi:hypothetical protein
MTDNTIEEVIKVTDHIPIKYYNLPDNIKYKQEIINIIIFIII